jgi:branched-chain amino acid transport system permease protein
MGLNVPLTKLSAFAISAFVAGLSGGLLGGHVGLLSPPNFAPIASLILFAAAVLVGARYPQGAVLAGAMAWLIPEFLRRLHLPPEIGTLIFVFGIIQALKDGGGVFEVINRRRGAKQGKAAAGATAESLAIHSPLKTNQTVLELKDLSVSYGQIMALNKVNLKLYGGQVLGLIGPNGAGKSSLVDAISGFTGYQGSVLLEGRSLDSLAATERARLGLRRSFQHDRTIPDLSARAYLELSAGRRLDAAELSQALQFAGLGNGELELHGLDVGTRRLLEVAGVLAAKPKAVLLDEPAAGLSSSESLALAKHIAQIPARYACAVLLIEHDMEVVRAACSEVVVLDFGSVIAEGQTDEVLSRRNVVAAYLGEEAG